MNYQRSEHIAAGNYKAGKAEQLTFQAYLGTCLGVALYDKKAKIGGMIHVLLPEPPSKIAPEFAEKYASTGIPILINELVGLGATYENLEATIAGGALVGPLSQQDINLDIGGRSADIAKFILKSFEIKILKAETGGFFTCTLELDMATGETLIQPAWESIHTPVEKFSPPTIDNISETIKSLKPIPQTALKILRMFQSSNHDISDITEELSKDQVLSGQALKICNSVLFAGTVQIDSLKEAILLLGEDLLVRSVITAAVNTYFNQTSTSGYSLCKGGLFFHAVGTAVTAEKISQLSGKSSPKQAYTAGLLHDIGKVVLDQYISEGSPLFFRNLSNEQENALGSEKKVLGINHCETGSFLAKKWGFSESLHDVISLHHFPNRAKKNKELVKIVYLADLIMAKFSTSFELEKMQDSYFSDVLKSLDISMTDLPELVDSIPLNDVLMNL